MLKEKEFKVVYSTGDHEPAIFFLEALPESIRLDLGLGYFSTTAINSLSVGFALFLNNEGIVRILVNECLSDDDKEAIIRGEKSFSSELIEDGIIDELEKLLEALSERNAHFFNCLSYLISKRRIEIRAIVPTKGNSGIAHQKFGLFEDPDGNKIAFSGSLNFSQSALFNNIESIDCYVSWENDTNDLKRITHYENFFNEVWEGKSDIAQLIPLERLNKVISNRFPLQPIDVLLETERELIKNQHFSETSSKFRKKYLELLNVIDQEISPGPSFPNGFKPFDYQELALKKWLDNDFIGFFEMATGTGKTITSLNCALHIYKKFGQIQLLILVPTLPLVTQWKEEVEAFNFENVIIANSKERNWTTNVLRELNKAMVIGSSYCIITTYDSFNLPKFLSIRSRLPNDTLLIADEAHNFGTARNLKNLPTNFSRRIGLSATPQRHFDPTGTSALLDFFGAKHDVTFKLGMKEAIERDFLCRYYYYPKTVELSESEMQEYIKISKVILMHFDSETGEFNNNQTVERLLLKRKRIINKAENKLIAFRQCMNELKENKERINFTLVYVPEGRPNQYDEEDQRLINEYSKIIAEEYDVKQHQFTGITENREKVLESFGRGDIDVLTAMKCLDEGVDVRRTENAIFCASTTNPRQFVQRRGRILRKHPDKNYASIYDLIVTPNLRANDKAGHSDMERKILIHELKRVYEFANLAENKMQALKSLETTAEKYDIDIFSAEII